LPVEAFLNGNVSTYRGAVAIGKPHPFSSLNRWHHDKKMKKSVGNVLCSSKNVSIFAADFAAHVLLALMLMR
jgi:hypothetical protein